ncbi:plasmid mobilization relaxosome protein MobC [Prevotella ihumii]|uniref:plasmid mobilization relaxosome protein MobC n=1 Tax=Prevotella ihumii TaxID=1917878 RepID=UPI0009821919|nr:plasmid mobilization relaxosome protein MobC [Prevotella ihumii]
MKEDKRTNRIFLVLNNRELDLFKKKAQHYNQMSAMIRDAVAQFDDKGTVKRIESLNKLADLMTEFNHEISKQGVNLNQITKRANELIYSGELNEEYYNQIILPQVSILKKMMTNIKKQQSDIFKRLLEI